eukprot:2163794-Rhodomonas_salina.1
MAVLKYLFVLRSVPESSGLPKTEPFPSPGQDSPSFAMPVLDRGQHMVDTPLGPYMRLNNPSPPASGELGCAD